MPQSGCSRITHAAILTAFYFIAIHVAYGDDFHPSPAFTGNSLPVPAHQKDAWTPPASKLPPKLVSATAELFEQGMADPRGLEYREVELSAGDVWQGDGGIVATHAWVFPPGASRDGQGFAVAWNGLVYPAITVGKAADLKSDVDELEKHTPGYRSQGSLKEAWCISYEEVSSLRPCLLLRLGEAAFAERIWKASQSADKEQADADADPYLTLADEWLFARYDRAVGAHMRGEDHLSLMDCAALVALRKAVTREGIRRKLIELDDDGKVAMNSPGPAFLDNVPELLVDEQRRVAEPPHKSALDLGQQAFKTKADWIAALVRDLDQVTARQDGNPGGVDLGSDLVVMALVDAGDDAVAPLLDCFEKDNRLARSVHFGPDFGFYRSLISVHEAAYVALCNILQESFFEVPGAGEDQSSHGPEARKAIGGQMRAYWNQFHGLSPQERWYQILLDDKQDPHRWASAADSITQRQDDTVLGGNIFPSPLIELHEYKPGEVLKLQGDVLRNKANPSVADLLVKRLHALEEMQPTGFDPNDSQIYQIMAMAESVADALRIWDGKAHLSELKHFCDYLKSQIKPRIRLDGIASDLTHMYAARARFGDAGAMEEFTTFLRSAGPDGLKIDPDRLFADAWTFPDDPAMQKVIEDLFNDPKSPWNPLIRKDHSGWFNELYLIRSPLLGFPGFRKQMLRMLSDTSPAGSGTIKGGGAVDVQDNLLELPNINSYYPDDPRIPKPGTKVSFRTCDVYAYYLKYGFCDEQGLPTVCLWWPVEKRDEAVKRGADLLARYGDRYKYASDHIDQSGEAHMSFPPLTHPATRQDVNDGRAIFSLSEAGEQARIWNLPHRPLWGRWIAMKAHYAVENKLLRETGQETDGSIWQAEEVLKNGKWQRYYGFVGHDDIARVPAEDIELALPGDAFWEPLSHQISCAMITPPVDYANPQHGVTRLRVGDPVPIAAALGNRRGLTQTVPQDWFEPNARGGGAFRPGVSLKLMYTARTQEADGIVWYVNPTDKSWTELPAKPATAWRPSLVSRDLEAGAAFEGMRFDLHEFFDLSRPGSYRLQIVFHAAHGEFDVEGTSHVFQFTLAHPATGWPLKPGESH